MEMSFVGQEDIIRTVQGLLGAMFKAGLGIDLPNEFPRMTYREAMDIYGSDKPDTRFDMKITERLQEMYKVKSLFNTLNKIDFYDHFWFWTENNPDIQARKLSNAGQWMGLPEDMMANAHDAMVDVRITANCILKMLHFTRDIGKKTQFSKAFAGGKLLA
jgi:aspartyl-tRNA synthetase